MLKLKIQGWPPTLYKAWGSRKFGRGRFKTREYLAFETLVRYARFEGELDMSWECFRLEIDFVGNWTTKAGKLRVQDSENLLKCTLDTLAAKMGVDDSRFTEVSFAKVQSKKVRMVEVRIFPDVLFDFDLQAEN